MKSFNLLALLVLTTGLGLLAAPSAQAGTAAPMSSCPSTGFSLDTFFGGGPTVGCSVGDKNFSNFIYNANVPAHEVSVFIGGTQTTHTLNFTVLGMTPFWNFGSGQFLKYDVTVNTNSNQLIKTIAGGMKTSLPGTTANGSIDVSSVHTGTCMGNVSNTELFDCTSSPINISPLVETTTINNLFNVTSTGTTGITEITNFIVQNSTVQAPGPLPILGVGVAFGMSRKIRRRISSAA